MVAVTKGFGADAVEAALAAGLRDVGESYARELREKAAQLAGGAHQHPAIYAAIRALHIPVWVVRARPQDPSVKPWDPLGSPTWPGLAQEFHQGRDLHLPDKTHFLPMEDPALMARLVDEALQASAAELR